MSLHYWQVEVEVQVSHLNSVNTPVGERSLFTAQWYIAVGDWSSAPHYVCSVTTLAGVWRGASFFSPCDHQQLADFVEVRSYCYWKVVKVLAYHWVSLKPPQQEKRRPLSSR